MARGPPAKRGRVDDDSGGSFWSRSSASESPRQRPNPFTSSTTGGEPTGFEERCARHAIATTSAYGIEPHLVAHVSVGLNQEHPGPRCAQRGNLPLHLAMCPPTHRRPPLSAPEILGRHRGNDDGDVELARNQEVGVGRRVQATVQHANADMALGALLGYLSFFEIGLGPGLGVCATVFFLRFVSETRERSLEEIERHLTGDATEDRLPGRGLSHEPTEFWRHHE